MRRKKSVVLLFVIMVLTWLLSGCASSAIRLQQPQIRVSNHHLEAWQQNLSQDQEFSTINAKGIRGLSVHKDGETIFAVSYEPRQGKQSFDYWEISSPYHSQASVNTEELYDLFDSVAQMRFQKIEGISLQEAGISGSTVSIFVAYNEAQNSNVQGAAEPTNARTIQIGDEDGQGHYYVAIKDSEQVMLVDQSIVDLILNVEPYQYILKIPVLVSVDTIEKVQILYGEEQHIMEQSENNWKMDGKEVSQEDFHTRYGELLDVMLTGEREKITEEERTPVLTVQYIRNMEQVSDIEVKYFPYDEQAMSVSVNGEENFLVDKKQVQALLDHIDKWF